jgi:hypothetical protein
MGGRRGSSAGLDRFGNADGDSGGGAEARDDGEDLLLVGRAGACLLYARSDLIGLTCVASIV